MVQQEQRAFEELLHDSSQRLMEEIFQRVRTEVQALELSETWALEHSAGYHTRLPRYVKILTRETEYTP